MPIILTATDATTGTYVKEEAASFLSRSIDGVMQMALPDANKALTDKEGFDGLIVGAAATCIATSMYTRARAARGDAPILKVLF